jgi:hypothetical protein
MIPRESSTLTGQCLHFTSGIERQSLRPKPHCISTSTVERINSRRTWYRPNQRCRSPRPARDPQGRVVWRACGGTRCSRECRDRWAWKHWRCLDRSFATLPPTHFVTIFPTGPRAGNTFAKDIGKAMTRLRAELGGRMEYARAFEWSKGLCTNGSQKRDLTVQLDTYRCISSSGLFGFRFAFVG